MMGRFVGRGNQYIQLDKVLYCKLPTIGKQLPTFPHDVQGLNRRPQRWEGSGLPLYHHGPPHVIISEQENPDYFFLYPGDEPDHSQNLMQYNLDQDQYSDYFSGRSNQ